MAYGDGADIISICRDRYKIHKTVKINHPKAFVQHPYLIIGQNVLTERAPFDQVGNLPDSREIVQPFGKVDLIAVTENGNYRILTQSRVDVYEEQRPAKWLIKAKINDITHVKDHTYLVNSFYNKNTLRHLLITLCPTTYKCVSQKKLAHNYYP